ncbi:MAG: hypothetical protein R6V15_07945 [Desulfotignum sp.]
MNGKPEKSYHIRYRKGGKLVEEKAGRQYQDDMTPAKAAGIRASRIEGDKTNAEKRAEELAHREAEKGRYTIDKLWSEYSFNRTPGKSLYTEQKRI